MSATRVREAQGTRLGEKLRAESPWDVVLHNDWKNSMVKVVYVLRRVIPGMTVKRAMALMYRAHSTGRATVKRCHKELAELYCERLREAGLTVSIEPAP
jgi:ATP-dependent Clp protease adaptor protein ClpS